MTDPSPNPRDWGIAGTYVFDGDRSRAGYAVNKLCMSLTRPENRERFRQDEEAYMAGFALSEAQKQAIRDRDWLELVRLGGNIYYMIKIGATVGAGLYAMGAQMRGQSLEAFLATRQNKGAV
ncbi:protocatechuate 3,4-dioxygenase [Pigmentiphaga sp. NML080357]|uniref:protocatechuate 3,4-dioxygenase n=1 Tax=Pigmentiphaga sp. NML080357 TaxID=2008675 RepID=UPI000B42179F|nr:protocatechuate 3,4-dioxygenase [Pigmentiphaga sp. NML080357]OVZ64678.1 protocatechuate 3,4-dioxygenase [Pigmentiphaga sp. NML080357]